jgi:hypothetical protein
MVVTFLLKGESTQVIIFRSKYLPKHMEAMVGRKVVIFKENSNLRQVTDILEQSLEEERDENSHD